MNIVIPLAGKSSRFFNEGFSQPKFILPIHNGKSMIEGAVDSLGIKGKLIFVVQSEHCSKYHIDIFLKEKYPHSIITSLDYYTGGCVESVYVACKKYIDNDLPLIISNCDQFLEWDSSDFIKKCLDEETDGCVLTYFADTTKNSYAKINSLNKCIEFREKVVISNHSLVGVHFWKKGSDFIESAKHMIDNNIRDNGEFYVSVSYNYLIQHGKNIFIHPLKDNEVYNTIGVPDTYYDFLQRKNPIILRNLSEMKRGWLVGDFAPSVLRTSDFEVGILEHKKGELWSPHVHYIATEINVLISGLMSINNINIEPNVIFTVPKGLLTRAVFHEDCKILCIKTPSDTNDKICF